MTKRSKKQTPSKSTPSLHAKAAFYEAVAHKLLDRFAADFSLDHVEGKQDVQGAATMWELDGVAVLANNEGFLIVEARRYTTSKLKQEDLGAFAYRIHDAGAAGGIIVSPMELQSGAKRIAKHEGIIRIRLSAESTLTEYVMQLEGRSYVGLAETLPKFSDSVAATVLRAACSTGRHEDCPGDCCCDCHTGTPPASA